MDAVRSFVAWPIVILVCYLKLVVAFICAIIPCTLQLLVKGPKSFGNFLDLFTLCKMIPFGLNLFSAIASAITPYTGSIFAVVSKFDTLNDCEIIMPDYPWLRNPFSSLHAAALINLGEFSSGLLMIVNLKRNPNLRGIPTSIQAEYYKRAVGDIKSVAHVSLEVSFVLYSTSH